MYCLAQVLVLLQDLHDVVRVLDVVRVVGPLTSVDFWKPENVRYDSNYAEQVLWLPADNEDDEEVMVYQNHSDVRFERSNPTRGP